MKKIIMGAAAVALLMGLGACTGRTKDNMKPLHETVEVNVPEKDEVVDAEVTEATDEVTLDLDSNPEL